jgi:hypothetical protein
LPMANDESLLSICFAQGEIVTELDRRLSAEAWSQDDASADTTASVARFAPSAIRNEVRLSAAHRSPSNQGGGWPWISIDDPQGSTVVLCGYPLVATWQRDATARYLLAAILKRLDRGQETSGGASLTSRRDQARLPVIIQ